MNLKQLSRVVLAIALAGMGLAAQAYDSYTFTSTTNGAANDTASGSTSLTTTGYYASNASTSSGITGKWSSGALVSYPGLGMSTDGNLEPNHALDSVGRYTEAVLLNFSVSTILTGVDLSYVNTDADISVFRYSGTSAPASLTTTGASLTAMQSAGWQLVGNYANLSADSTAPYKYNLINGATDTKETPYDNTSTVVPTASGSSVGSSWWLIVAYNSAYGGGANLEQGNDYFKLLSVTGEACGGVSAKCGNKTTTTTGQLPEPGSLALAGLALAGIVSTRRRPSKIA